MVKNSHSEKEPKQGRPSKTVEHLKMQVIPDLKSEIITDIVKEQLEPSVELTTDDSTFYIKFDKHVQSYQAVTADKNTIKTIKEFHSQQFLILFKKGVFLFCYFMKYTHIRKISV